MTSRNVFPHRGHAINGCPGPPPQLCMGGPPPHHFMGGIQQDLFGALDYINPAFYAGCYAGHALSHCQYNHELALPASYFLASRAYNQLGSFWWSHHQPSSGGNGHFHHPSTKGSGRGQQYLK